MEDTMKRKRTLTRAQRTRLRPLERLLDPAPTAEERLRYGSPYADYAALYRAYGAGMAINLAIHCMARRQTIGDAVLRHLLDSSCRASEIDLDGCTPFERAVVANFMVGDQEVDAQAEAATGRDWESLVAANRSSPEGEILFSASANAAQVVLAAFRKAVPA